MGAARAAWRAEPGRATPIRRQRCRLARWRASWRGAMNDMQQYLVDEFVEEYRAGRMTRREALQRVTLLTGSAAAAGGLVGAVTPVRVAAEPSERPALQWAPQVSPFDPAV